MHNKSNLVSIWDFPQLARFDQYYYLKGKVKANQVLLQSAPYHVPAATSHSCFLYAAVSWKGKQSVKKKNRCTTKSQANKSNRWSALFGYTLALVQVTKKNSYENSDVELCMHCKTTQLMFKIWITHWQYIGSWWVAMDFYLQRVSVFRWGCAKNMWYNWSVDYFWSIS